MHEVRLLKFSLIAAKYDLPAGGILGQKPL